MSIGTAIKHMSEATVRLDAIEQRLEKLGGIDYIERVVRAYERAERETRTWNDPVSPLPYGRSYLVRIVEEVEK